VWNVELCLSHKVKTQDVENRVVRKLFGPKKEEVTGQWRKLRND
jgi:hypothetical protein